LAALQWQRSFTELKSGLKRLLFRHKQRLRLRQQWAQRSL